MSKQLISDVIEGALHRARNGYYIDPDKFHQMWRTDNEILAARIGELESENAVLHEDVVNLNGCWDMQMKEIARLKDALNKALAIESLDEENLNELIDRCRKIIDSGKKEL